MNEKMKKAEYLFSELSGIDERFVKESLEVRGKRSGFAKKALVVLVAAAFLMTMLFNVFVIGSIISEIRLDKSPETVITSFEEVLSNSENSARVMSYSASGDIDLFDGAIKLIWNDGDSYKVIRLSGESERRQLDSAMSRSFANAKAVEGEADLGMLVWVSYGDGRVVTPYLKNNAGNVGYGELFEYDPEIVPTDDMSDFVNYLVTS